MKIQKIFNKNKSSTLSPNNITLIWVKENDISNKLNTKEAFPPLFLRVITLLKEIFGVDKFWIILPLLSLITQFICKATDVIAKGIL